MKAPVNPEILGNHDTHANAAKYEGIASGRENAMVSNVRPRTPDKVVIQAVRVPTAMLARVTLAVRTPLRHISERVRRCNNSSRND
jgi:hypothetical protein